MIHEEICTYEVAKLAKEKGFDVDCEAFYYNDGFLQYAKFENYNGRYLNRFSAPTQSLLQRWMREEKNVQIIIKPTLDELGACIWGHYSWFIFIFNEYRPIYYSIYNGDNSSYELALEDALKYALENLV